MLKIDFNQFKIKNPNYREAFEELCYHLFCRKFHLPEGVRADFNETGLETKPILHNGAYHGFQSKFFDHKIDGGQIQSSVEKAIKHFKGSLDVIYIYLNILIGTQAKYATQIERKAKRSKILVKWIVPSNFTSLLANPSNLDLAQLYFGQGDEFGFIKSSCDHSIVTFLQSAVYLSLPFKNATPNEDIAKSIQNNSEKVTLILGHPGSGKTIFMQNLLVEYGGLKQKNTKEMRSLIEKTQALPMLINLKDCVHDSIENIIRNRQRDYNVDGKQFRLAYLIDGLDEINTRKLDLIFSHLSSLVRNDQVKLIVFSCRSGNPHRYLLRSYFPNPTEYEIDVLNEGYIERYFKAKNNTEKLNQLAILKQEGSDLLREIKDIFLVSLLWDTAETLGPASTFLDILQHKLDLLLEDPRFKKNIEELNLIDPKKNAIELLNQEISFEFQKHFQYRFNKDEIQKIILNKFPRVTYQDVNAICNYLCSHYFTPRNVDAKNEESYVYQHRRYQEFYFAQKLKIEYEKDRRILRERMLSNREFMESIFLPYLRQQYERDNNFPKIVELNLIDVYMGKHPGYGADESYYSNASSFVTSLAAQPRDMFDRLLADENLRIKEKVVANPTNIVNFWQSGKIDFSKELLDDFEKALEEAKAKAKNGDKKSIEAFDKITWDQWEDWLIVRLIIRKEKIDALFEKVIRGNYSHFSSNARQAGIGENGKDKLLKGFIRVCLNHKFDEFITIVDRFDEYEILSLLSVLSEMSYIAYYIRDRALQTKAEAFLTSTQIGISEQNHFLLFFKKLLSIKLTEDEAKFGQDQLLKLEQERPVDWRWSNAHTKYARIAYSLNKNSFEDLSKGITKDTRHYYNELFLYTALFTDLTDMLRANKNITQTVRSYLTYIKFHEDDRNHHYLKADVSSLWGYIFAKSNETPDVLFSLKNLLVGNEDHFNSLTFSQALRTTNMELFNRITNEQEFQPVSDRLKNWNDDFPSYVEMCFDLAILLSTFNKERALFFISQGINEGILRHGWRKDHIVSYNLVEALEIIWRNNWMPKDELTKYVADLFKLTLRVSNITDGKGTWQGPYNVIDLVARYDIPLAERLRERLYSKVGRRDVSNTATTSIALAKARRGFSLDDIGTEMSHFRINYSYDGKPHADSFEQKFKVYLKITRIDLYSNEEKAQAFLKAYEQIEEMIKREIPNFLNDIEDRKDREYFSLLCKKYKKNNNLPDGKKMDDVTKPVDKVAEIDYLSELQKATTKESIDDIYKKLKSGLIFDKKELWDILVDHTYKVKGDVQPLISLLKEHYYPHTDFYTFNSRYYHFAVAATLRHVTVRGEMLSYLYKNSGHQGFLNIMRAYEVNSDKWMCLKLFDEFYSFCDFLVN